MNSLLIPGLIVLGGGALLYFGRPNASQTLPPVPRPVMNAPGSPATAGWAWPVLARFPPGYGYGPGTGPGPEVYVMNPYGC